MDLLIEGHLQRVADRLETDDSLQRSLIHAWVWDEVALPCSIRRERRCCLSSARAVDSASRFVLKVCMLNSYSLQRVSSASAD